MNLSDIFRCCLAGLLLQMACANAAVNDVFPGDYAALAVGDIGVAAYAYDRKAGGPFRNGNRTADNHLDSQVFALRFTRTFDVGGTKVSPVLVLSSARASIAPAALAQALAPERDGVGDLRLGATAWLIDDLVSGHWLGISGMVIGPTGTYHPAQPLNVGENRWRYILSGGWVRSVISRDLLFELSPEFVRYGDNDEYLTTRTRSQKSTLAWTGYLRYRFTPALHGHLGWQENRGGVTSVNGVSQNDVANNTRAMAGATLFLPDGHQLILRVAKELKIDNGYRQDKELALRWLKIF
jgi:hypothetical protein